MAAAVNGHAEGPTIPASADTLLRFQFERGDGEPEDPTKPVYLLASPSNKLLLAYRAALASRGIENPSNEAMAAAMALCLERTKALEGMEPKFYDWYRSLIERFLALDDTTSKYERAVVEDGMRQLQDLLEKNDERIATLRKKRDDYANASMRAACAVGLVGWEHRPGTVERRGLEATAETLAQIEDSEQQILGLYWLTQRNLSTAQKKTSDSPPPSPTTPETIPSPSDAAPSLVAISRSRGTKRGTNRSRTTLAT